MRRLGQILATVLLLTPVFFTQLAHADDEAMTVQSSSAPSDSSGFHFAPQLTTVFPTFAGGGGTILLGRHFEFGAQYGLTPGAYYKAIAATAAHLSHNEDYKNIIDAAFNDNHILRAVAQFDFSGHTGWRIGVAGNWLHSSGDASVDDVLKVSSGSNDFTLLKAALLAQGKGSVNMKTDLIMGEAYAGYAWDFWRQFRLSFDLGVLKVITSKVKLEGGTAYEKTASGMALVNSTQSNIESIIKKYGITPTAQFTLDFVF